MDNNYAVSRALQDIYFIWYLYLYIDPGIDWKSVAGRCIGKDNEYCLKMIKSKCWTDKSLEYSSIHDQFVDIFEEVMNIVLCSCIMQLRAERKFNRKIAILTRNLNRKISPFAAYILDKTVEICHGIANLYNIHVIEMTLDEIVNDKNVYYVIIDNMVDVEHPELINKLTDKVLISSNVILYHFPQYLSSTDCINSGFMVWEYLLYDTFTYPGLISYDISLLEMNMVNTFRDI